MRKTGTYTHLVLFVFLISFGLTGGVYAQATQDETYSPQEIVDAGHKFFGTTSSALAKVVEYAFKSKGRPNAYIIGEEGGGAFIAGLRYGEGMLYPKSGGQHKIYWQGPSFGFDFGANGSRTLTLIYNMNRVEDLYNRFVSLEGSAYIVGGFGMNFQHYEHVSMAPIRTGVGLRLGINMGYVKYTPTSTWNPF
jgi:hypothetical protein